MNEAQKAEQIKRAIWLVSADAHKGEKPREDNSAARGEDHDHRFLEGMPGMGMMPRSTPDLMWMDNMGWVRTAGCHHCSMPLAKGDNAWRAPQISAGGWTLRVLCALCARDMSTETKGEAVLRIPLESPDHTLVIFADEKGELSSAERDAVFLEEPVLHAKCYEWSKAFSSRAAFEKWAQDKPRYRDAKLLSLEEWAQQYEGKPDTYEKPQPPAGAEEKRP